MTRREIKARIEELNTQLERALTEDRLEAAVDTTTKAAVVTGTATLGTTIASAISEDVGLLIVGQTLGRVFNGFIVVDVVLGLVLLHKRMKKRREKQPITIVTESVSAEDY